MQKLPAAHLCAFRVETQPQTGGNEGASNP